MFGAVPTSACETQTMSRGGTSSYRQSDWTSFPQRVREAVERAESLNFELCVRPEIGRLLAVLAAGLPDNSLVGETGTGTGAGLAWMVSAASPTVHFVSFEIDEPRAQAASELFEDLDNVAVVCGDAAKIYERGPFDLLVHDGGPGSGKNGASPPIDPAAVLRPGGTMTVDDYTPTTTWPPMYGATVDQSRVHWLEHPTLRSTEVRVAADLSVVVSRYLPSDR
jgi:predicted O-methyltransferase YrrM